MHDDIESLTDLNIKIGDAENKGDVNWLASVLAPKLAFQRADDARTIDDREAYLQKVKPGGTRVTSRIDPIEVYGDRAIVKCIIKVGDKEFHNIRLFVRRE